MTEKSENSWWQARKLEDYRTCFESMRHEDERKAYLLTTYFLIQGVLGAFYGWITDNSILAAMALAAFAVGCSILWYFIMKRMQGFIELRYVQLALLEKEIGEIHTITYELELRSSGRVEELNYQLDPSQNKFSISRDVERRFPLLVGVVWTAIFIFELLTVIVNAF